MQEEQGEVDRLAQVVCKVDVHFNGHFVIL